MVEEIVKKLQIINASAVKAENFDLDHYDELYDIYQLVTKQNRFSTSEMEAIISELGSIRRK